MSELKTSDPVALHFLMTDDLFNINEPPMPAEEPGNQVPEEQRKEEAPVFDYQGDNNRYILLLHHSPGQKHMPANEFEALQSILSAKKMELKDIALVNLAEYPGASFDNLKAYFACSSIILFGIPPQTLKMPELPMNVITSCNGVKVLFTYNFGEMLGSNDKKRLFWNEMKKI